MSNQRKEDRCCRIVPSGYEWGFLGMEGRGLYAGGTAMGIHGEWSQLNDFDIGFEYRLYYGSTDEGNDHGADNIHRKVSRLLWIPELGSYGIFKRGESVDVTRRGVQEKQKEENLKLVAKFDNTPNQTFLSYIRGAYESGTALASEAYKI